VPSTRYHTVQEFNKGVYDYIIATDETGANDDDASDAEEDVPNPSEQCEAPFSNEYLPR
jgi:ATP-dependent RNA helicase DDX56/DBP9